MWILAAKLTDSDFSLNVAADFILLFFARRKAPKDPPENPPRNSSGNNRARKTNKHWHFWRDGVRDKQELSLGQTGPAPQKNIRNPNHHYFEKEYCNTPPICIGVHLQLVLQHLWFPTLSGYSPLSGRNWDPSLGQTGRSLLNSTVKSPFCPVCPWDGWGVRSRDDCPARASEKMLMCFLFIVFFRPQE